MNSADQEPGGTVHGGRELSLARAMDSQIERIRRIGKRLFQAANCIVTFHDAEQSARDLLRSADEKEAAFCSEFGKAPEVLVVTDTLAGAGGGGRGAGAGAPGGRGGAGRPGH